MSVILRKLTGCSRSAWGAQFYAAILSVIAAGKLNKKNALQAVAAASSRQTTLALAS